MEERGFIRKIAGIIAYRLSRFKIVYLIDNAAEDKISYLLQDLTALTFICERILYVRPPNRSLVELAYQISRRHANQETLAVCFDTFFQFCERIKTAGKPVDIFAKVHEASPKA